MDGFNKEMNSIQFNIPREKKIFHTDKKEVMEKKRKKESESRNYTKIQFERFQPFHLSIRSNLLRGKIIVCFK